MLPTVVRSVRAVLSNAIRSWLVRQEKMMVTFRNMLLRLATATLSALIPALASLAAETPTPPAQVCANNTCTAAATTGHPVIGWKFVPMNYYVNEGDRDRERDDIRAAMELGLTGFGLEIGDYAHAAQALQTWPADANLLGATGFGVFLILDMGPSGISASQIVSLIKTYGNDPHYLKVNGKPLLSTYGAYPIQLGSNWWKTNVLDPLAAAGHPVTFIPVDDRAQPNTTPPTVANWNYVVDQFPVVDGLVNFSPVMGVPFYTTDPYAGRQLWSGLDAAEAEASALHAQKKLFISPYRPYYWQNCKLPRAYFEHQGGRGMDNFWRSAITKQKADMVVLVTWDDYSESTFIQPTRIPFSKYKGIQMYPHLGYYELEKYYVSWYKNGSQPKITKDSVFFFYRTHPSNAVASDDKSACPYGAVPDSQKWGLVQDDLYVTTALTAPAELVVTSGGHVQKFQVAAGLVSTNVPFTPGKQEFALERNGTTLTDIVGSTIEANPKVYNFNLTSGFSISGGKNSNNWEPSEAWASGSAYDWFSP